MSAQPLQSIRPRHSYGLVLVFAVVMVASAWYIRNSLQVSLINSQASQDSSIVGYPDEWVSYGDAVDHQLIAPSRPVLEVSMVYDPAAPVPLTLTALARTTGYPASGLATTTPYYIALLDSKERVVSRTKFLLPSAPQAFSVAVPWDESVFSVWILNAKRDVIFKQLLVRVARTDADPEFYTLAAGTVDPKFHILFIGPDYDRAERIAFALTGYEPFRSHASDIQFHLSQIVGGAPHDYVIDLTGAVTDQEIIDTAYRALHDTWK